VVIDRGTHASIFAAETWTREVEFFNRAANR
jgi:hypothetical protein